MIKHISFPSIEQYRNIIATVNREYNFIGVDENGDGVYDISKPKPKLTFTGTVKLHGTNFSVCYNDIDGMWVQSKENIITIERDNAGSAFFVKSNEDAFKDLFKEVKEKFNLTDETISIYGEWAGKGIQRGVAISEIDKSMFIFGIKISPITGDAYWVDPSSFRRVENRIFNIYDYKTFSIEIDFNYPQLAQNKIIDMTIEVEDECPVAKDFGISGIGEGIVFSLLQDGKYYKFKSKGEKHSKSSKVKTLKPVDDERINKVIDVVNRVCISWRLDQALTEACNLLNGGIIDRKFLGDYIRLVIKDILKEESDIIAEAGLEPKDITAKVSEVARQFFFEKEREYIGV